VAIETSDLNDKDILASTKQVTNGKGSFQYRIKLSDGHEMTSEWIPEDKKSTGVVLSWCEAVRQTAVSRSQDREAETLAQARRKKLDEALNDPQIVLPAGVDRTEAQVETFRPLYGHPKEWEPPPGTGTMGAAIAQLERQAEQLEAQAKSLRSAADVLKRS
jgi:hypothetical protein